MKICDAIVEDIADFIGLEPGDYSQSLVHAIMEASKSYISGQTGIPISGDGETINDYDDLYIAFLVLCQDMYDNRGRYVDGTNKIASNKTVDSILNLHQRNVLCM